MKLKPKHYIIITKWLNNIGKYIEENKAWWRDDETPRCG